MICIGIDPGESSCVAAVQSRKGARPVLVGLWPFFSAEPGPWLYRADAAFADLADTLDGLDDYDSSVARVLVEGVVKTARGPFAHHASGWGLGHRAGQLYALAWYHLGVLPEIALPSKAGWWGALAVNGRCLGPKRGDGLYRLTEAALFVDGAEGRLRELVNDAKSQAARERVVDAAEAVLIAASACYARGGA